MITYVLSRVGRVLRESLTLVTAPPLAYPAQAQSSSPRVTLTRTLYLVHVDGVLHRVRRDRVCDCGGTPQRPCPAIPLVQDYLAAGGQRPLGRHEDTWPDRWLRVPLLCPVCDCPTLPDRYVDSSHGPGWRCTFDSMHYWMVRMNPLRRYLALHPPQPRYPWNGDSPAEQQAWLQARAHRLRIPAECTVVEDVLDSGQVPLAPETLQFAVSAPA
jgi:hypothetical protein